MKKFVQKLCLVLLFSMLLTVLMTNVNIVNAESFKANGYEEDDKFKVSYDSQKYKIYWVSRKKITARSQYGSWWSDLDEGDRLGTATIRTYYLEPKSKVNGAYYAIAGCQISMDPCGLRKDGDIYGMSQQAQFGIKTINPDSRVCSPTKSILNSQVTKTSNNTDTLSLSAGVGFSGDNWEANANINYTKSWGSSSSCTYSKMNVGFTQRNDDGNLASWRYDYKSRNNDATWNEYLFSSSKVFGQVVYRLNEKPSDKNRNKNIPERLDYDIRFGAGNISTGEVADRFGPSKNRDMYIKKGSIKFSY